MSTEHVPSKRPFRLYNSVTKKNLRSRNFKYRKNAHIGALIEARWSPVGTTIEVINADTGKEHGQYTRRPHTVSFSGGDRA